MRKTLSYCIITIIALVVMSHLPPQISSQTKGTPIASTGMPAPMLYDTTDPVTGGYPCDVSHTGLPFYNMTSGIARPIWICNGTAWIQAQSAIQGATASLGGALILLGGSITGTATVTGAPIGSNCIATPSSGAILAVGLVIDCAVGTTGIATVRISALVAGTPTAQTFNVRVIQ